jgi:hypothetical protein
MISFESRKQTKVEDEDQDLSIPDITRASTFAIALALVVADYKAMDENCTCGGRFGRMGGSSEL